MNRRPEMYKDCCICYQAKKKTKKKKIEREKKREKYTHALHTHTHEHTHHYRPNESSFDGYHRSSKMKHKMLKKNVYT